MSQVAIYSHGLVLPYTVSVELKRPIIIMTKLLIESLVTYNLVIELLNITLDCSANCWH